MARQEWNWNLYRPERVKYLWTRRPRPQETLVLNAEETKRWQADETFRNEVEQFARQIIATSGGVTKTVLIRRFGRLVPLAEVHATNGR